MQPRRFRGDGGAVTTEFVIIVPGLLLFIMVVIQAGLYFHAVSVASTAAQEGARIATLEQGDTGPDIAGGEAEAADFIQTITPSLLTDVAVQGQLVDDGDLVRMTVTADVLEVYAFPGIDFDFSVNESSESVVEQFRPVTEGPPQS